MTLVVVEMHTVCLNLTGLRPAVYLNATTNSVYVSVNLILIDAFALTVTILLRVRY